MARAMRWIAKKVTESEEKPGASKSGRGSYRGKAKGAQSKALVWRPKKQEEVHGQQQENPSENPVLLGSSSRAQTVEKVGEIPQVGQTLQGTTQKVNIPIAEDAPAQVVEQMIAGEDHPVQVLPPQVVGTMAPTQMAPVTVPAVTEAASTSAAPAIQEDLRVGEVVGTMASTQMAPVTVPAELFRKNRLLEDALREIWQEIEQEDLRVGEAVNVPAHQMQEEFLVTPVSDHEKERLEQKMTTAEWFETVFAPMHVEDWW